MFYVCTAQHRGCFLAGTPQGWPLCAQQGWTSPPTCVPDPTLASGPFPMLKPCTHLPPGTSSQTPGLPLPNLVPQRSRESLSISAFLLPHLQGLGPRGASGTCSWQFMARLIHQPESWTRVILSRLEARWHHPCEKPCALLSILSPSPCTLSSPPAPSLPAPHPQVCVLGHVQLFVAQWTVAHQASLPVGFSGQESWSGLPFPPPGQSSRPRHQTRISCVSCIGRWILCHWEDSLPPAKPPLPPLSLLA